MDNTKLLKISIIIAFSGIITLFLISKFIEIDKIELNVIDKTMIGKTVKVEGKVKSIQNLEKITILKLENSTVEMILFSKIEVNSGEDVSMIGKVDTYEDKLQIKVDTLKVVS